MKIENLHKLSLSKPCISSLYKGPQAYSRSLKPAKLPKKMAKKKVSSKSTASKGNKSNKIMKSFIPGPIDKDLQIDPLLTPTEAGSLIPSSPEEDEVVYSDNFRVKSSSIKCVDLISDIQLPKFGFIPSMRQQNSSQGAKQFVLIEVMGGIDPKGKINAYTDLLKASRDGIKDFSIELLGEKDEVIMTMVLDEPRVHAIDFGDLSMERDQVRTLKVEIDYTTFTIDGETI